MGNIIKMITIQLTTQNLFSVQSLNVFNNKKTMKQELKLLMKTIQNLLYKILKNMILVILVKMT